MEKTTNNQQNPKNQFLSLENRRKLHLSGITEIISSSDTNLAIKLKDDLLTISGSDINIQKLDVELGILDAEGQFDKMIYNRESNIFKRLFKWLYRTY